MIVIDPKTDKRLLNSILSPSDTEWRKVTDIKSGDHVLWWTQRAEVIKSYERHPEWCLVVHDQVTRQDKTFYYKRTEELRVVS